MPPTPTSDTAIEELKKLRELGENLRLAGGDWSAPWQDLISTLLSARTRDDVTIPVAESLFQTYPHIEDLAEADLEEIEEIVGSVNFYKTKAKRVLAVAEILTEQYDGEPPLDLQKLLELPGVGRKTANVFLSEQGKAAIGVDTHVAYAARSLGWTGHEQPDKIEQDLRKLFPKTWWRYVNPILVRFGRSHTKRERDEVYQGLLAARER